MKIKFAIYFYPKQFLKIAALSYFNRILCSPLLTDSIVFVPLNRWHLSGFAFIWLLESYYLNWRQDVNWP